MKNEKYLVTGAAGFIGGNITRKLIEEGKNVFPLIGPDSDTWRLKGLDIDPDNFLNVDVTDFVDLREKVLKVKPTHILHLATYGVYRDQADQLKIFNTNVLGTANLLRVSLDLDIAAFVNTGSVYEYGNLSGKQSEANLGHPRNMYDLAKIVGTQTATNFSQQYGLPVCTLRLFTAYGPYEDTRRLVPSVILNLMHGQDLNILAPQAIRDFIHVQDIAEAYFQASLKEDWKGEVINIGSGQPVTVAQTVNKITNILGIDRPPLTVDHPISSGDSQSWADLSIAKNILQWQPKKIWMKDLPKLSIGFVNILIYMKNNTDIPVFIFCGGKGTRLREETEFKPKPMVLIGGKPILWHIMKLYRHWGYKRFILCLGYKANMIKDYFISQQKYVSDFYLDTKTNQVIFHQNNLQDDFQITFVETGEDTLTSERLLIASKYLEKDDREFMVTYGDGLTDLNIKKVLAFHRRQGTIGTITAVHPTTKYGVVKMNKKTKKVNWFQQYPVMADYINAGFMVFQKEFLKYLKKNEMIEPVLADLAKDDELSMYAYNGYWQCMDTYKDVEDLNDQWKKGPRWKIWQ